MTEPVPTPGGERSLGALMPGAGWLRGPGSTWLKRWAVVQLLVFIACTLSDGAEAVRSAQSSRGGLHRRAVADDEIAALWERKPPRSDAHRSYVYIDEEEIVEAFDLPVFRVEGLRSGVHNRVDRMVGEDRGAAARVADLAPELARETVMRQRAESAFYSRRPGVSRDVPDTPDVIVGPILALFGRR